MATKLNNTDTTSVLKKTQEARQKQNAKEESEKTASKKSLRIDMQPEWAKGIDLDQYLIDASQKAGLERGITVSKTRYVQELIIKDKEEHKNKSSYKLTKREKIYYMLEKLDDKKLSALATLLDVQY